MKETCHKCGQTKEDSEFWKKQKFCIECMKTFPSRKTIPQKLAERLAYLEKAREYSREYRRKIAEWKASLNEPQKPLFDRLEKDGRIKIIYGARSVLCDVGNGLKKGHWIPDLPLDLTDVWNQEPLSVNWFSERGKANLERIGRNIEKEKQRKALRAELKDLDREIAEDEYEEVMDGALL